MIEINMQRDRDMGELPINNFQDLYRKHCSDETNTHFLQLWHYTSADGLLGIIRNEPNEQGKLHFWFTRSDCLNDTSEGTHILRLFRQVCIELLQQNTITPSFYEAIKDSEISNHQFVNFPIPSREEFTHESILDCVPCHAYICSFSLKEDSLDMWRYYSKGNGGYGLKCYSLLFDELKDYEHSDYQKDAMFSLVRSYRVIYNDDEKKQILRDIIIDTSSVYEKSDKCESDKAQEAKGFIQYTLKIFQFQFKHECYSSEQEYRFVFYLPYSKPELLENKMPNVKFRTQNGMPIPYIDLTVENGDSYLDEVLISPFVENQNALATTSDYLIQCGFNCKVRRSELPVRK